MFDEWRTREVDQKYQSQYDRLAQRINEYNAQRIDANGLECPICNNKGLVMTMAFTDKGEPYTGVRACVCQTERSALGRKRRSGLGDMLANCTFDRFETKEPWQQRMKDKVLDYVANGVKDGKWLFIGGQPGCGKSFLATAAVGKLVQDYETTYAVWPRMAQELKSVIMDGEAYDEAVRKYQTADLLMIDDFFKPTNRKWQSNASDADVRIAFDIINYRYINQSKLTIVTSEWMIRELDDVDEAVASRIYERSEGYILNIKRDSKRNYRYKGDEEI